MKILLNENVVFSSVIVSHNKDRYIRILYTNGKYEWRTYSYDGELEDKEIKTLEKEFQKLIALDKKENSQSDVPRSF